MTDLVLGIPLLSVTTKIKKYFGFKHIDNVDTHFVFIKNMLEAASKENAVISYCGTIHTKLFQ